MLVFACLFKLSINHFLSMEETDVYILLRRDYVNAKTCIRHPYQSIRQKVSSEICSGPFVKNAQC